MNYIEFLEVLGELWSSEASSDLNLHSLVIHGPLLSSLNLMKFANCRMFRWKEVLSKMKVCLISFILESNSKVLGVLHACELGSFIRFSFEHESMFCIVLKGVMY